MMRQDDDCLPAPDKQSSSDGGRENTHERKTRSRIAKRAAATAKNAATTPKKRTRSSAPTHSTPVTLDSNLLCVCGL